MITQSKYASPLVSGRVAGMSLRPTKVLQTVMIGWFIIFLISPIDIIQTNKLVPLLTLYLGISLIWGGAWIGERTKLSKVYASDQGVKQYARVYRISLIAGAIGVLLRSYDWLFVRGLSISETSFQNRELLESASGNFISMLSLILVPLLLAAFLLRVNLSARGIKIGTKLDIIACVAWPALNVLVGSRSSGLIFLFALVISFFQLQNRFRLRQIFGIGIVIVAVLVGMNIVLFNRFEEMGISYHDVARLSGYTYFVPLNIEFLAFLEDTNQVVSKILFLFAHYMQYILHGTFEYVNLFNEYTGSYTFGQYQFFYIVKALSGIFGFPIDIGTVLYGVPRIGVYDTFFGPAFVDFWYMSMPFAFLVGLFSGRLWKKVNRGDIFSLPLYVYLIYIIALVPVVNGILFSGGLFFLISFMLFKLISKFKV